MTATLIDRLVARAMTLAADASEDDAAMAELRHLAGDDHQALEQAIRTCLARPASLASRHRAIELLARVRYEDPSPTTCMARLPTRISLTIGYRGEAPLRPPGTGIGR
jgi:hypothetical protein